VFRSLIYFRRAHLAVALATGVVTAVLTGALLMGDSVRGSLRALAVEGLGDIELALESPRFFRQSLAGDLAAMPGFAEHFSGVAPAIRLAGSAVHAESGRRATGLNVHGVEAGFLQMVRAGFQVPPRQSGRLPGVVINQALAHELGAVAGDDVVIRFPRFDAIPRDTLLGRRAPEDVAASLRLTVAEVVSDHGAGRFGLTPHQGTPLNLFVDLEALQRRLDLKDEVNSLFLATTRQAGEQEDAVGRATELLRGALTAADVQLVLKQRGDVLAVESAEFVLRPHVAAAVMEAAAELNLAVRPVQTYLANALKSGEELVPYSSVAAVGGPSVAVPFQPLLLVDGSPAPQLKADEILLGAWAAKDLGAEIGAEITVDYYVVDDREQISTESRAFTVAGILASRGLAMDPGLTPDYPGIADADSIAEWDPPFPVKLSLVRPRDEEYWDRHRGAPKAFFAPEAAAELWSTRHGHLTSLRLAHGDEEAVADAILKRLDLPSQGYVFRAVRRDGLAAAKGATDFSQLFMGFSFFLIIAAAMLVGLLFGLGVEQRSSEVGVLLAVGFSLGKVRRRFLGEALVVSVVGVLAGAVLGIGYAAGLMEALRTIWRPAIGSSELYLHTSASTLAMGAGGALLVTLLAVVLSLRRLSRRSPAALLAGATGPGPLHRSSPWSRLLSWGGLLLALGLAAIAMATGQSASPGLSFGTGAGLLTSGLAFFAGWCRGNRRPQAAGNLSLAGMAMRNSSWSPGRSILSLALVACATFVIITVAANRHEPGENPGELPAGTGGFALQAESSVPIYQDLNGKRGRYDLGFDRKAAAILDEARVVPFRLRPGSDASCLNLYAPGEPRILGAPPELTWHSDFSFQAATEEVENPWTLLDGEIEPGVIPAIGDAASVQWILHLGLGQDLIMEDESGAPLRLRVVALLSRSIFQSELLISEENFRRYFPSRSGASYFLIDTPPEETGAVAEVLESGLESFGLDTTETSRRLADYQAVENTYLSTFQALGGLGLLLGTLGLGIVLLRNVLERRGELATLRAFGFPRHRLARMVLAETAFLLVLGVALGSAAALLAVVPRLYAGELALPWFSLARTLGLVIGLGMLSCLAAVRSALRAPLLGVLKSER
jgi:putative ABC transport system permease protein